MRTFGRTAILQQIERCTTTKWQDLRPDPFILISFGVPDGSTAITMDAKVADLIVFGRNNLLRRT